MDLKKRKFKRYPYYFDNFKEFILNQNIIFFWKVLEQKQKVFVG